MQRTLALATVALLAVSCVASSEFATPTNPAPQVACQDKARLRAAMKARGETLTEELYWNVRNEFTIYAVIGGLAAVEAVGETRSVAWSSAAPLGHLWQLALITCAY